MKKFLAILILAVIFTGVLVSCKSTDTPPESSNVKLEIKSDELRDYIDDTVNNKSFPAEKYQICVTDADNAIMAVEVSDGGLFMTELTVKGKTIVFDEKMDLHGNFTVELFEAEGIVVFQKLFYNTGNVYVFWENNGFEEFHSVYNESIVSDEISTSFYKDNNGGLKYRQMAVKFEVLSQFWDFSIINGRNDFYEELGSVSLGNDGKLVFTQEKTVTIYEYMDGVFERYYTIDGYDYDGRVFYTLNEIFEYKEKAPTQDDIDDLYDGIVGIYNKETGKFYRFDYESGEILIFYSFEDYVLSGTKYKDNVNARDYVTRIFNSGIEINYMTAWLNEFYGTISLSPWASLEFSGEEYFNFRYDNKYYSNLDYYIDEDKYVLRAAPKDVFENDLNSGYYLDGFKDYIINHIPESTLEITKEDLKNLYLRTVERDKPINSGNDLEFFQPFK
jgi:hypothetical protein